jgi:NADPH-dependent 7-cyano-7-deazaguanine reductase QueF
MRARDRPNSPRSDPGQAFAGGGKRSSRILTRPNAFPSAIFDCYQVWENIRAVCPENGHRDRYVLKLNYRPAKVILELGSLRRYLRHFDGLPFYHESLANQIFNDIVMVARPRAMEVELIAIGGIPEYSVKRTKDSS